MTFPTTPPPKVGPDLTQRASERTPVAAVGIREVCLWLCGQRTRVRVEGDSMHPTLRDGEYVLVRKQATLHPGDIVLCTHPFKKNVRLLKRAAATDPDGVFVLGDAPSQSTDSRSFGSLPWTHIIGVVTSKMS